MYAELLGQRISVGSREALLASAAALVGRGGSIATVNPIMLVDSLKSEELFFALRQSLLIPDGVGIRRALGHRGVFTEVFPGVELCEALLDVGSVSFAIVGGREGVAEAARDYLLREHNSACCLFVRDGYGFSEDEVAMRLSELKPDILLVCLGSPRQELFISRIRHNSEKTLYIGLGGSLDVYSGRVKRAPLPMRRSGLEWLFRMLREPRRIAKIPALADFLWLCRLEEKASRR